MNHTKYLFIWDICILDFFFKKANNIAEQENFMVNILVWYSGEFRENVGIEIVFKTKFDLKLLINFNLY